MVREHPSLITGSSGRSWSEGILCLGQAVQSGPIQLKLLEKSNDSCWFLIGCSFTLELSLQPSSEPKGPQRSCSIVSGRANCVTPARQSLSPPHAVGTCPGTGGGLPLLEDWKIPVGQIVSVVLELQSQFWSGGLSESQQALCSNLCCHRNVIT